jgi:hypothetical protein
MSSTYIWMPNLPNLLNQSVAAPLGALAERTSEYPQHSVGKRRPFEWKSNGRTSSADGITVIYQSNGAIGAFEARREGRPRVTEG